MEASATILADLPNLPQVKYIHHATQVLSSRQDVHAFWLDGSFARGEADLFEEFWIISHKHAKVLFRNLDVLALVGIEFERTLLTRLWYAWLTGKDLGKHRPTVHLFTQVVRTLQEQLGPKALSVLGASLATRSDLLTWISIVRDK
jgi:hypothetical protein